MKSLLTIILLAIACPAIAEPFAAWVVLMSPTVASIGGDELGIDIPSDGVMIINMTCPGGRTNAGLFDNHLVSYATPVPAGETGTVLSGITLMVFTTEAVPVNFGPSVPSSFPGMPAVPIIADGEDHAKLLGCAIDGGENPVAGMNWTVPAEGRSLSGTRCFTLIASPRAAPRRQLRVASAPETRYRHPRPARRPPLARDSTKTRRRACGQC